LANGEETVAGDRGEDSNGRWEEAAGIRQGLRQWMAGVAGRRWREQQQRCWICRKVGSARQKGAVNAATGAKEEGAAAELALAGGRGGGGLRGEGGRVEQRRWWKCRGRKRWSAGEVAEGEGSGNGCAWQADVDIMWFRNPLPFFYPDGDFQISCDNFLGDPTDLKNWPNNGFNYVKSNNRSIEFYKYWYSSRARYPGVHEQNVLNIIKYHQHVREIGVRIRFLNTKHFGGFCEPSKDLNKVCTMHANCCIGLQRKISYHQALAVTRKRNITSKILDTLHFPVLLIHEYPSSAKFWNRKTLRNAAG
ncbi:hypothetical protein B296_00033758, partial [Ensete ventricosum]